MSIKQNYSNHVNCAYCKCEGCRWLLSEGYSSLIPEGVKIIKMVKFKDQCKFCKTPCNQDHCPYTEKK